MEKYEKLQEKLSKHPIGAPRNDDYLEILKILFPEDEIDLALLLEFRLSKTSDLAKRAGIDEAEASRKLEAMACRGSILSKKSGDEMSYALLPNYPGLMEYPVMKGDEKLRKRLAELWHSYYMKDMGAELAAATPAWNRVLPAENAIPGDTEILPFEIASRMMEKNEAIAVADCPCRIMEKNCDKPLDVCISFDGIARFLVERGMGKLITLQEARDVLKRSEEAGLVHMTINSEDRLTLICNCCPCCCHLLMLLTKINNPDAIARSSYLAKYNADECIGCGICEERCPMGAFTMDDDLAVYDPEKCIGCGLCVSTCAVEAITLAKRDNYQPPSATIGELVQKIVSGKRDRA